jgi:hypothetical protein
VEDVFRWVKETPDAPAVVASRERDGVLTLTYRELGGWVKQFVAALVELAVKKGHGGVHPAAQRWQAAADPQATRRTMSPRTEVGSLSPPRLMELQRASGNTAVSRAIQEVRPRYESGCGHQSAESFQGAPPVQRSSVTSPWRWNSISRFGMSIPTRLLAERPEDPCHL